jgi:hypothetical protein
VTRPATRVWFFGNPSDAVCRGRERTGRAPTPMGRGPGNRIGISTDAGLRRAGA